MATPVVDFKTKFHKRLEHEFEEDICLILRSVLLFMSAYTINYYGLPLLITTLMRTQEEQDAIYQGHSVAATRIKYRDKPWKSFHQFGMAADLRYRVLDAVQWEDLITETSTVFKPWGIKFLTYNPSKHTAPPVHVEVHKTEEEGYNV